MLFRPSVSRFSTSFSPSRFAFAFDIDGVLLRGKQVIPGAREALSLLDRYQIPYICLTNGGGVPEHVKAEKVSQIIGYHIPAERFILAHTPLKNIASEFADHLVLAVGSGDPVSVLHSYGFRRVVTGEDVWRTFPSIHMLGSRPQLADVTESDSLRREQEERMKWIQTMPFAAILVLNDVLEFGRDIQICLDILISMEGKLGSRVQETALIGGAPMPFLCHDCSSSDMTHCSRSPSKTPHRRSNRYQLVPDAPRNDKESFCYSQPVRIVATSPDLLYPSEWLVPRLGQRAFVLALEALFHGITASQASLCIEQYGKPSSMTYAFVEQHLQNIFSSLSSSSNMPPFRIYGVGDNPFTDILGANNAGEHFYSILTRTGLWGGHESGNHPSVPADLVVDSVLDAVHCVLRKEGVRMDKLETF